MKFYKVINNEFKGFYDLDIHRDILFDGEELKQEYHELSEEKWQELLGGQSEGKEIRMINGEVGLYEKPKCETEGANVKFDYEKEIYFDDSTNEEKLDYWENELIKIQKAIIERKELGLYPNKENIARKQFCLAKHNEISQEIAFEIEKSRKLHHKVQ